MENIIYNELLTRGYNVDVGIVETFSKVAGKSVRKNLEVDFVCNQASKRYYIQSAFEISAQEKFQQEENSLRRIDDAFKKIIVVKDTIKPWYNDRGVLIVGLTDFLLDPSFMDL
ncbi:MAG: ATP-binding protein [Clostridiaceae bacterium]|jgi:hypothetical protein|nr:ATP-binding protein [Clostridiaceae bacterium]